MHPWSRFLSAAGLGLVGLLAVVTTAPVRTFADNPQEDGKDEQEEPDECEGVFPGDGRVGPALSYTDNGNGTFTDHNTQLLWEKKTPSGCSSTDVHCVDNTYTWSAGGNASVGFRPDGTLFTDFLQTLNNTCERDPTTVCTTNRQCASKKKGKCGFAGHRDWRMPNVKELQSIVDYSRESHQPSNPFNPVHCIRATATSVPGATAQGDYWSSTPIPNSGGEQGIVAAEWGVTFQAAGCPGDDSSVGALSRTDNHYARAVRDCHINHRQDSH